MTNGCPLYYESAGKGDHIILCLPGALGNFTILYVVILFSIIDIFYFCVSRAEVISNNYKRIDCHLNQMTVCLQNTEKKYLASSALWYVFSQTILDYLQAKLEYYSQ